MSERVNYGKKVTKLRVILVQKGLTQKNLADMADLEIAQVSQLCSGKRTNLLLNNAKKIAKVLNVTLDEAFGDDENNNSL